MLEPLRMAYFMHRLLKHAIPKQALVPRGWFQSLGRNNGHVAWASGFAEYEVHPWDEKVEGCDAQQSIRGNSPQMML